MRGDGKAEIETSERQGPHRGRRVGRTSGQEAAAQGPSQPEAQIAVDPEGDRHREQFPAGFFTRADERPDPLFYEPVRLVQHLDDAAIAAVGDLYDELRLTGHVLDLCASWVSHFRTPPARLTVLGMNAVELERNPQAHECVVHDLNADPNLPFGDASFHAVTCCVSVDYLTRPLEVFDEVARVLRPDGVFVCTFSNRCFPTKAIQGWLATDDAGHVAIVEQYFRRSHGWDDPVAQRRTPAGHPGDPLFAVWAGISVAPWV